MNLRMLTGVEALAHIGTAGFESDWKALHAACPWATACQHPDFVMPWYRLYRYGFSAVVLVGLDDDGSLQGLLTLALSRDGRRLTGAGGVQAEYQGWLAGAATATGFAQAALARIRDRFPGASVGLKYLPPGIPLDWVHAGAATPARCVLHRHERPLMRIDAAAMDRQRRKKNHRQNYNRLSRLGDVAFERVTGKEHFTRVFDAICAQYDFRQAALYGHMPFSNDPLKKLFYLELHRRGLLHATVLTVENEIVASHLGLLSKERAVHLGINTHAPAFAAHSPGHLLLALLGVHLAKERVEMLDLTPGGDRYKELFASEHDVAYELTMFGGPLRGLHAQAVDGVKRSSKALLGKAGWRSADVLAAVGKLRGLGRLAPGGIMDALRRRSASGLWVRRRGPGAGDVDGLPLPVARNCLDDAVKYDDTAAPLSHQAFVARVMKRMEQSWALYSHAPGDTLVMHCWVRSRSAAEAPPLPDGRAGGADGAFVLFDLQRHPRLASASLAQRFVTQVLADLDGRHAGATIAFSGSPDAELQAVIQRCGFARVAPQPRRTQ